ncbi:hypothetical protein [Pseudoalteromonas phenolica]|uniref:hypothetical protein n=1 Tax=Pseudoalteromonas phenolica TaxID=161398 RepID=UPI00110BC8C0|nr:hypothetical protein [Pseudoalteromonas phenolica]TMO56366.1 hypothetical protein CWC21_06600 [Pseudoalteromonas phenolica]
MNGAEIIISNALLLGALGFLLKLWIEKKLSLSLNAKLEKFKSELAKEVAKSSVQQTHNYAKKLEICATLNELMTEADFELKMLYFNVASKYYQGIEERNESFVEKYLKINALLHKNELYIEDEIIAMVHEAYRPIFDIVSDVIGSGVIEHYDALELSGPMSSLSKKAAAPRKAVIARLKEIYGINT